MMLPDKGRLLRQGSGRTLGDVTMGSLLSMYVEGAGFWTPSYSDLSFKVACVSMRPLADTQSHPSLSYPS